MTFSSYANQDAGYRLYRLDPADSVSIEAIPAENKLQTDGTGFVKIVLDAFRGNHYGVAVYKDADGSGTPTSGDTVWNGSGSGSVGFFTWTTTIPIETSRNIVISDWATYGSQTPGPY